MNSYDHLILWTEGVSPMAHAPWIPMDPHGLGDLVQGGGCLVQDQQLGAFDDGPRHRQALLLATAQLAAPGAHIGVPELGEGFGVEKGVLNQWVHTRSSG